jgi:hypothetical protein
MVCGLVKLRYSEKAEMFVLSVGACLFYALYVMVKEIVERRHGEPKKFLFLPKMGLLGSQAGNEKNCWL